MAHDLIGKINENKYDNIKDSRGSKVQNQNDSSMKRVREDDNGRDADEEADNGTDDDDDEDTDQEEGEEEDEDTDKKGGEEEEGVEDEEEEEVDEEDEDEAVESEGETKDGTILSHDDILNITAPCHRNESVSHVGIHVHLPQALSSLNNNDEVRIAIQAQDLNVLPSKSSLQITGRLTKANGIAVAATTQLNNGICLLFDELRYELNGFEIDRSRYVGLTSLMKGYATLT